MDIEIGKRIKKIRQSLELTQAEFTEQIRLSRSFISSVEKGKFQISRANIKNIANTFKINEQWLLTGKGNMFVTDMSKENSEESISYDTSLMEKIINTVENLIEKKNIQLPIKKKAKIIALFYEYVQNSGKKKDLPEERIVDLIELAS